MAQRISLGILYDTLKCLIKSSRNRNIQNNCQPFISYSYLCSMVNRSSKQPCYFRSQWFTGPT